MIAYSGPFKEHPTKHSAEVEDSACKHSRAKLPKSSVCRYPAASQDQQLEGQCPSSQTNGFAKWPKKTA